MNAGIKNTPSDLVQRLRIHLTGDHVQRIKLDNEAADRIEQLERELAKVEEATIERCADIFNDESYAAAAIRQLKGRP